MRKFIIATLLSLQFGALHAYNTNCSNEQQSTCASTPGCYWIENTNTCNPCPSGTYNDGNYTSGETCISCGTLGSDVEWDTNYTGATSATECRYTATCEAKEYFAGYSTGCRACSTLNNLLTGTYKYSTYTTQKDYLGTVADSTSNQSTVCATCGKNSTTDENGLGCTCFTGYHVSGKTNNDTDNDSTDCVANTYTITYQSNNGQNETETQSVTYNQYVTLLSANTFSKTGHTLSGWTISGTTRKYTPSQTFKYAYTYDITMIAQWSGKEFTVTYDAGNAGTTCMPVQQTCTYGGTCNAQNVPSGCTYAGYIFQNWTYNNQSISPGENIANASNGEDMTLTAAWGQCPAGHYCANVTTASACPAGSTSAAGSTAKTNCYMTGGTTKICDANNNCFPLPDTAGNIYYHNGQ